MWYYHHEVRGGLDATRSDLIPDVDARKDACYDSGAPLYLTKASRLSRALSMILKMASRRYTIRYTEVTRFG